MLTLIFDFILHDNGDLTIKVTGDTSSYLIDTIKNISIRIKDILKKSIVSTKLQILNTNLNNEIDDHSYKLLNKTDNFFNEKATLIDIFNNTVHKYGNNLAVVSAEESMTFGELAIKSRKIAKFITDNVSALETTIGVLCDRTIDFICIVYGILYAGKAYVPLDPKAPKERHERVINQSDTKTIICSDKYKNTLPQIINISNIEQTIFNDMSINTENIKNNSLAYVIFTSG